MLLALYDALGRSPACECRVEALEVDFPWPAQRIVAETDGRRHHATGAAWERDRARRRIVDDRRLPRRALHLPPGRARPRRRRADLEDAAQLVSMSPIR